MVHALAWAIYYIFLQGNSHDLHLKIGIQFHASFVSIKWGTKDSLVLLGTGSQNEGKAMKYIICDFDKSNWGKTKTLLEVIKQLKEKATLCVEDLIHGEDKYVVFDLKGKKVVVNTQGDPDGYQEKGLQRAVDENADIILCASREKGKTKIYVNEIAKKGYEIIWFSNLFADNEELLWEADIHRITAESIVKLIEKL